MARGKIWSKQEDEALLAEAADGMFFDVIAGRHQRSKEAVRLHYLELLRTMSPRDRAAARLARDVSLKLPTGSAFIASEAQIADRDARAALAPRPFGDPLPGRSALDQMRAGLT